MYKYRIKLGIQKILYHLKFMLSAQPTHNIVSLNNENEINNETKPPPIFLIGCYRSGTSLMRRIIDSHSQIACPPESKFMKQLLVMLEDQGSMDSLKHMGFPREDIFLSVRRLIESYYFAYAKSKGKSNWSDKNPQHVDHLCALDELFSSQAKMVFIYRNGLDVAASLYFRNFDAPNRFIEEKKFANKFVGYAAFWADQITKMQQSEIYKAKRFHRLKYEDLVSSPDKVLKDLFVYLGLPYEPEIKDYYLFEHDRGEEDGLVTIRRGIKPSVGNFRKFSQDDINAAMELIGDLMDELGYEQLDLRSEA